MSEVSMNLGRVSLVPKGEYDPAETYKRLDVVRREGSSYLALKDGLTGVLPIDGENWMCLAGRGDSAYQQAVDAGLVATEPEFKSALAKIVDAWGNWHYDLADEEMSDPDIVYERTRPVDWMKMPELEDVQDGEFWLLFQWLPGDTTKTNFTVYTNSDLTVEAGRYENGVFTPLEKYTQDYTVEKADTRVYPVISLDSADFADVTSEGKVQAMVRISGEITRFESGGYNNSTRGFVECMFRASKLTYLQFTVSDLQYLTILDMSASATGAYFNQCMQLRAIRGTAKGLNGVVDVCRSDYNSMFRGCCSLSALPKDTTLASADDNGSNLFGSCYSLRRLPQGITLGKKSSGGGLFSSCLSLRELPPGLTLENIVEGLSMFQNCYALRELPPGITLENVTNAQSMFQNCYALRRIINLYIPNCNNMVNAFYSCTSLEELTFDSRMTTWETPQDIALNGTALSHVTIVNLFNSLPTIDTAKTINLTNTPGASQVTAEEAAIATDKGWKLTGVAAAAGDTGMAGPDIFDDVALDREPYFLDQYGNEYYGPFYKGGASE